MNDEFKLYFMIGLLSNVISSIGLFLYGISKNIPREIRYQYTRTFLCCQFTNITIYCILAPIFMESPPSIIVIIIGSHTVNFIYLIMKYDQYTDQYIQNRLEQQIHEHLDLQLNSNDNNNPNPNPNSISIINRDENEPIQTHQQTHQQTEIIRTITSDIYIPDTSQYISCNYVQYTNSILPITVIQPDGHITLGITNHINDKLYSSKSPQEINIYRSVLNTPSDTIDV